MLRVNIIIAIASIGAAGNANAVLSLTAPADGTFLTSPDQIVYKVTGTPLKKSPMPFIVLSGANFPGQSVRYVSGTSITQTIAPSLPNNSIVTALLNDGGSISKKTYRTVFPYLISSQLQTDSMKSAYLGFPAGNCTNFAARAFVAGPSYSPAPGGGLWRGNAKQWYANASAAGWSVSSRTTAGQVGSVIVWDSTVDSTGHVGIITDIKATGSGALEYTYAEENYPVGSKPTWRVIQSTSMARDSKRAFIGFVNPQRAN